MVLTGTAATVKRATEFAPNGFSPIDTVDGVIDFVADDHITFYIN